MNTAVNLLVPLGASAWSALEGIAHWQRQPGGVRRLCLYHTDEPRSARDVARRLERFVNQAFPDITVQRREGGGEPRHLRRQLDAWQEDVPAEPWVIDLTDAPSRLDWSIESRLGNPDFRIVERDPARGWVEIRRGPEGDVESAPLTEFRRDATQDLPIPQLIAALRSEDPGAPEFSFSPAPGTAIPMIPLTEAAIANQWRWAEAFKSAGVEASSSTVEGLFSTYLAGLLSLLGAKNLLSNTSANPPPSPTSRRCAETWINTGGRLLVFEAVLDTDDPKAFAGRIARAGDIRARFSDTPIEWHLVSPDHRVSEIETLLAKAHGIGLLDLDACHTLPSRISTLLAIPLNAAGIDVERLLKSHLGRTGNTRVLAEEPAVLQSTGSSDSDPIWADADSWLENVMRERGQNWLLSTHRGRAFLCAPVDGRSAAAQEWKLLVVHTSGLDEREVTVQPLSKGGPVVLEFPESPGPNRRVAAWLKPFQNRRVSFTEAQARFAVQARIEAEAANAAANSGRTPAATPPAPPRSAPQRPSRPAPTPAPAAPPKPARDPLADLDRALDDALGG